MKTETYFCLVLSESQARFFATSKYGIDRMKALMSLVEPPMRRRAFPLTSMLANLSCPRLNYPVCGSVTARLFPEFLTR